MNSNTNNNQEGISKFKKYSALTIVGLMAFTMLGFGLSGLIGSGSDYAVKVEDKQISPLKFNQMLENQKRQYVYRFGIGIADSFLNTPEFTNLFVNQLVDNLLIAKVLEDNGIVINEDTIKEYIINHPQFKNTKGEFDRNYFQSYLSQMNMSEDYFMMEQKNSLTVKFLLEIFNITDFAFLNNLAVLKIKEEKPKRVIQIREFKIDNAKKFDITEDEIKEYHSQNQNQFIKPEEKRILLAKLNEKTIKNEITEEAVQSAYKKLYVYKNQTVSFYRLSFTSFKKAEEVLNKIKEGAEITSFAPNQDAYFEGINYSELSEGFQNAISKLKIGDVSGVFDSNGVYNIVKLKSITSSKVQDLASVRQNIIKSLQSQNSCSKVEELAQKITDELESGADLEEALKGVVKIDELSISKNQNAQMPDVVKQDILDNTDTRYSKIVPFNNCEFFVYKIKELVPETTKDISLVKNEIIFEINKQKSKQESREKANEYYVKMLENKDQFTGIEQTIAKESKFLPAEVMELIFKATEGELIAPQIDGNKFLVIKLKEIEALKDSQISPAEIEAKARELKEKQKELLIQKYLEELRKHYKVKINPALLKTNN